MTIITSLTGRRYSVLDASATVYNEAKARLVKYQQKINEISGQKSWDETDDLELAQSLLLAHYGEKANREEETLTHIIATGEDVTGK